jgi:hypothetical protein
VEAFQMTPERIESNQEWPGWLHKAWNKDNNEDGALILLARKVREYGINTLEGVMQVSVNDYIIKGIHGELYPCKPDIFEKLYEKVD